MKRQLAIALVFLLSCISSLSLFADNEPEGVDPGSEYPSTPLTPPKNPGGKPKMPSRQVVWCSYDGENIVLEFAYPEGMCDVMIMELSTNFTQYHTIDSSELLSSIYIGELNDSFVTVTTSAGHTYCGELIRNGDFQSLP